MSRKLVLECSTKGHVQLQDIAEFLRRCTVEGFGPRTEVEFTRGTLSITIPEPTPPKAPSRKIKGRTAK